MLKPQTGVNTMSEPVAQKLGALLPDPSIRNSLLWGFVDSMRFIRDRKPDWCLVHTTGNSVRLFAGRLIVLTLHGHEAWLATVPSEESDLSVLPSWRWDTESYPEYRRIPSRNGYYAPARDLGADWPAIRERHFAYLEHALTPGVAPDPRSIAKHDVEVVAYLDALFSRGTESAGITRHADQRDGSASFTHAEFFPLVAKLILRTTQSAPGEFVTHDALVELVLADDFGSGLVARARARSTWPDDRSAASNMVAWFSQQISVGRSEWAHFFERERIDGAWAYRPASSTRDGAIPEFEVSALEGEPRMFLHLRRERDPGIVRAKRAAARNFQGQLECEACGFVAQNAYPLALSGDLCEVHHRYPLGDLGGESRETRLEDLAILCPNCHRAIHQTRPMMTVDEFREHIQRKQV